jgi:hypothetical protein
MATKKAAGRQVTTDKSMKKTSIRTESTKKKSITKKGEGKYESGGRRNQKQLQNRGLAPRG